MASAAAAANKRRLLSGNVAVVEDEDTQTRQKEAHSLSQEYSDELSSSTEKKYTVSSKTITPAMKDFLRYTPVQWKATVIGSIRFWLDSRSLK